jgi:predicted kinase
MTRPSRNPPPVLTIFCGLPGSGKTTLAREKEAGGAGVRLCTDDWQFALGIPFDDGDLHERLQQRLYEHALLLLRHGVNVIYEDGLWTRAERAEKIRDARAAGARIELHLFQVPLDELERRLERRATQRVAGAHPVTPAQLAAAARIFDPPTPDELARVDRYELHGGR